MRVPLLVPGPRVEVGLLEIPPGGELQEPLTQWGYWGSPLTPGAGVPFQGIPAGSLRGYLHMTNPAGWGTDR